MSRSIISVVGLIRKVSQLQPLADEFVFYRGHSNRKEYKLQPSLHRNDGWRRDEHLLVNDILSSNPYDFRSDSSMFEKLVRMQHHSLPTRLLDVTSNPLMALYFACCEHDAFPGEVVIVRVKRNKVKYSDSDTVSCISNVARLTSLERKSIDTKLEQKPFNASGPISRMLHFIKEEKPYFTDCIVPGDLRTIVCVRPRMSNERITSQSGAFLLFGLDAVLPESGSSDYRVDRVPINAKMKKKICTELEALNVHRGTIYPNIESSAMVIRSRYFKDTLHNEK